MKEVGENGEGTLERTKRSLKAKGKGREDGDD